MARVDWRPKRGRLLAALAASILTLQPNCFTGGAAGRHCVARLCRRAESEPRELVDLYGMKTRELKAFLREKDVFVEDCFDMESLIQRAAATEEDWGRGGRGKGAADTADAVRPEVGAVGSSDEQRPGAEEIEKAWERLNEAWPGQPPRVFGPADADKTVVLLHGFGDQDAQFLADTFQPLLNIQGLRLILPQAPQETLQGQQLQSWFLPINGQWIIDDKVVQPTAAYVHAMLRREIALGVPAHRIIIGGFAQGAGCALRAALSFPDAALGGAMAISGFFGAPEVGIAPANKRLAVLICHGKSDEVVPYAEGSRTVSLLQGNAIGVSFKEYDMKHGIASDEMMDIFDFVEKTMSKTPEEPLAFDPASLSPSPAPPAPAPGPRAPPADDAGVPTMDPEVTLQLLNDQEIADAAKDPEGMAVIQDVMMDPANLQLHKQNPRVARLVSRLERILSKDGAA